MRMKRSEVSARRVCVATCLQLCCSVLPRYPSHRTRACPHPLSCTDQGLSGDEEALLEVEEEEMEKGEEAARNEDFKVGAQKQREKQKEEARKANNAKRMKIKMKEYHRGKVALESTIERRDDPATKPPANKVGKFSRNFMRTYIDNAAEDRGDADDSEESGSDEVGRSGTSGEGTSGDEGASSEYDSHSTGRLKRNKMIVCSDSDEIMYNADRIVGARVDVDKDKATISFLTTWEGFSEEEATWEKGKKDGGTLQDAWVDQQNPEKNMDDFVQGISEARLAATSLPSRLACLEYLTAWQDTPKILSTWERSRKDGGHLTPETIIKHGPFPSIQQLYRDADVGLLKGRFLLSPSFLRRPLLCSPMLRTILL